MRVDTFDFDLPEERIALRPARPRDSARLLHVPREGAFWDRGVRDLPELLKRGDVIVVNDTAVIAARLRGRRVSRGADGQDVAMEALLHKQIGPDSWLAFAKPAKRLRAGDRINFGAELDAICLDRTDAEIALGFRQSGDALAQAISAHGETPLPPYIASRREPDTADAQDYQTMFADKAGSVAAPTASLHFTPELLAALEGVGVGVVRVTLHVGAGTFLPVKADQVDDHVLHSEWGEVCENAASTIEQARAAGGRIMPIGTTSLRILETAAREDGRIRAFKGETDLFIKPGFPFQVADLLMTNFHLPRSTLFMLVCAFSGLERMRAAYAHAIEHEYRFFSYGDACLLERSD